MKQKYGYKVFYKGQEVSGGGLFPSKQAAKQYAKGFKNTFEDINVTDIKIGKRIKY